MYTPKHFRGCQGQGGNLIDFTTSYIQVVIFVAFVSIWKVNFSPSFDAFRREDILALEVALINQTFNICLACVFVITCHD